ncbi:hypothetical protein F7725_009282 [Dissostichus mawsoni]|uniref:Uncharacterized protein n=1 Tax=Dissostichus mawsoni TaxID=36200 RepID=A0A7J5Z7D1_DISMA|nr:hypothetical protein F7725_009282 [Dissostichus mawsoni]
MSYRVRPCLQARPNNFPNMKDGSECNQGQNLRSTPASKRSTRLGQGGKKGDKKKEEDKKFLSCKDRIHLNSEESKDSMFETVNSTSIVTTRSPPSDKALLMHWDCPFSAQGVKEYSGGWGSSGGLHILESAETHPRQRSHPSSKPAVHGQTFRGGDYSPAVSEIIENVEHRR